MPAFIPPPPPRRNGWDALPSYQPERSSSQSGQRVLAVLEAICMVGLMGFVIVLALVASTVVVVAFAHWAAAGFPLS